jgi:hypothetical protein
MKHIRNKSAFLSVSPSTNTNVASLFLHEFVRSGYYQSLSVSGYFSRMHIFFFYPRTKSSALNAVSRQHPMLHDQRLFAPEIIFIKYFA